MPLRDAVNLNTVGTKRVLELAEGMKKLEVGFVIISSVLYEKFECEIKISIKKELYVQMLDKKIWQTGWSTTHASSSRC